ncbi:MAG: histidine phosphatase family protein [Chloroflexi bacterium]|nr:histidine phosphatase family protein [Chloroflexota bacterium]
MTSEAESEPRGQPIDYYFRDVLLIGSEATRLYLVRHAQSEGNRGEYTGPDDDPPLSEVGREHARRLAERFARQRVDAIYSSPLRRTQETARAIAGAANLKVRTLDDLREVDLGQVQTDYEAYTEEDARALRDRVANQPKWDSFPGSEGSAAARRRVVGVMDRIIEECGGKRVAVVAHAAVIQTYVSHVLGLERDFVFYPFNAGITSIRAQGDRRVIWRLNDIAHLDGMPPGFGGIS